MSVLTLNSDYVASQTCQGRSLATSVARLPRWRLPFYSAAQTARWVTASATQLAHPGPIGWLGQARHSSPAYSPPFKPHHCSAP
ncbi:hypothetical protein [Leptolyngbya iicbica]|uniref:hypothetical protein n=1 Tax=Leptolyngbya iicbica TaxID=3161580 RepID=UPI0013EEB64B|nr:hypothetical protein [Leptolyngbya sp. LK]